MKTLYINTVTAQTTIALYQGHEVIEERRWPSAHDEAERLQPAVELLLSDKKITVDDINQLLICIGPGGFTSSRIGVSAVNTWSFTKNIPVGQVSVFDLYQHPEAIIIVSSNSNEGWVKFPGKPPAYLRLEELKTPEDFSFAGLLHDDWVILLKKRGGTYTSMDEQLPKLDQLEFQTGIVKPWYYKDANITWSTKHGSVHRLNPDR